MHFPLFLVRMQNSPKGEECAVRIHPMADTDTSPRERDAATAKAKAPSVAVVPSAKGKTLALAGDWTVLAVGLVEGQLVRCMDDAGGAVTGFDLSGVSRMDTTGALLLRGAMNRAGLGPDAVTCGNEHYASLLELTKRSDAPEAKCNVPGPLIAFLNSTGAAIVAEYRQGKQLIAFFGQYIVESVSALRRPRSIPLTALAYHMEQVGVAAVPIVALLSFLIGLVIAYMGAQQLSWIGGAQIFVVNLVEIVTLRELGVLLTSIVIAGRSGSSFTAQIGAMVANEEVAAMQSMGLSPTLRLVFPRITALLIMLPALVFLANIMGILGGGVAALTTLDLSPSAYAARFREVANLNNFFVGMIKAPFFAVVIGTVGCFQGFQVTGSAESVGRLTTQSVVESIFLVIVLDALFAILFSAIGI